MAIVVDKGNKRSGMMFSQKKVGLVKACNNFIDLFKKKEAVDLRLVSNLKVIPYVQIEPDNIIEDPNAKAFQFSYGRRSEFAGKRLYKSISSNPRRYGTSGYRSWLKITNGMTYEDYIEADGKNADLRWAVERGWVIVK